MRTPVLFLTAALLTLAAASALAQTAIPTPEPFPSPPPGPPALPSAPAPTPPPEKSIDQLLAEVEQLRAQKAELDKREQELVKEIRKKLDRQAERVKALGIAPAPPAAPLPSTGTGDLSPPRTSLFPSGTPQR